MVISAAGLSSLLLHEGNVNKVYLDPVGIPTACAGHTATVTRMDVGKPMSDAVCARLLREDTRVAQRAVGRLVKVPISQDQYDALVSFTFNVGEGNFAQSTLLRRLNLGDCFGAGREFPKWNKARGRVLPGLVKRRADEQTKFVKDCR